MLAEIAPQPCENCGNRQETAPAFFAYTPSLEINNYYRSFRRSLEPFYLCLNSTRLNQRLLRKVASDYHTQPRRLITPPGIYNNQGVSPTLVGYVGEVSLLSLLCQL